MSSQNIQACIGEMKQAIVTVSKEKESRRNCIQTASLDIGSKENYIVLKQFLPRLEIMLQDIHNNITVVSQMSVQLEEKLNTSYCNKRELEKGLKELQKNIDKMVEQCKLQEIEKQTQQANYESLVSTKATYESELHDKKQYLKQAFIPIYALFILKSLERTEQEIYQWEDKILNCQRNIEEIEKEVQESKRKITTYRDQINSLQKEKTVILEKLDTVEKQISEIHLTISSQVNNAAYLAILKNRIEEHLTHGLASESIMEMLDKDPEEIHYEEEAYFSLLKTWKENANDKVFQEFIMKVEKEFFENEVDDLLRLIPKR